MTRIYKIISRAEWATAKTAGALIGSAKDLADGYIHLSTAAQASETARLHFQGQTDLVLLTCEAETFGEALKWEPSRGGQLFPHLFIPLPVSAVLSVDDLPLDAQGAPQVPALDP